MTAYEDAKRELESQLPEYIKKVGEFQYNNQTWRIKSIFKLKNSYAKCSVCGKPNIINVFTIENVKTREQQIVGNVCINNISNTKIEEWYMDNQKKLETLEKNRNLINITEKILDAESYYQLPFSISRKGVKRLEVMLDRMCKGYEPLESQVSLLLSYAKKCREENL